jgi:hypothetical protein
MGKPCLRIHSTSGAVTTQISRRGRVIVVLSAILTASMIPVYQLIVIAEKIGAAEIDRERGSRNDIPRHFIEPVIEGFN